MTKTMSIPDFVRHGWCEESPINAFLAHLDRHKIKYRIIGTAVILFLGFTDLALASGTSDSVAAFASGTGIDKGANQLYKRIISVGKWVIIIKGGIDIIKSALDGDYANSKTKVLGYVLTYAILWALPWAFGEVEKLFTELEASAQ